MGIAAILLAMTGKQRYSIRRNSVAMTRMQWVIIGIAVAVGVVGGTIIATTVSLALGGIVFAVVGLTTTMVLASAAIPTAEAVGGG
jgi:hypothetical protein